MRFRETPDWREEDLHAIGALPLPGRRVHARRRMPWIRIGVTCAVLVTLIAVYAPDHAERDQAARHSLLQNPPQLLAPPSPWRDLIEGDLAIAVQSDILSGLPFVHASSAHDAGTLRDTVEIGRFRLDAAYFRVLLERSPGEARERSFFIDLALSAAEAGLAVARIRREDVLETRGGPVEMAEVRLENGLYRDCLAFRARNVSGDAGAAGVKQLGWLCAPGLTGADLACVIDGLQLRHRETGLLLGGPFRKDDASASSCPHGSGPLSSGSGIMHEPGEAVASLAGAQPRPVPPRRPRAE